MRLIGGWLFPLLLLILGIVLYFPPLGSLFLWDLKEMRLAEAAREMVITQEFYKLQVNFKPTWDIGPLAVWWQALSMQVWGMGEIGVRVPNALLGCLSLLSIFVIGRRLHGAEFAFMWTLLAFCPLGIQALFHTGLAEPAYGFFFFVAVSCIAFAAEKRQRGGSSLEAALAGLFLGLAVLADGVSAFVLVLALIALLWLLNAGRALLAGADVVVLLLALAMTTMLWFGYEWAVNGPQFVTGFLQAQNWWIGSDEYGQIPSFLGRIALLLFGLFPTGWIALSTLIRYREKDPADFRRWMVVLVWLSLIVLLFLPQMALTGLSLAAYPLGYLATLFINQPIRRIFQRLPGLWTAVAATLLILGVSSIFFPLLMASKAPWLMDKLLERGYIAGEIWTGFEGLAGMVLLMILVPVFRLGKEQKHGPATLFITLGMLTYFTLAYPFLGYKMQDLLQGGYPKLFAQTGRGTSYSAAIAFKSYAPLFYGERHVDMLCNGLPDSCFLKQRVPVGVYKVVPIWAFGSGRHLAGFEEVGREGGYVLFRKFNERPGH